MSRAAVDRSRLAFILGVRGALLIGIGGLAIRWPDETLPGALVAVGVVAGILGLIETGLAGASRELPSTKLFLLGHGGVSIAFGVIAVVVTTAQPAIAARLALLFVLLYAAFAMLAAARLQFVPRARDAMLVWGTLNVACAAVLLFDGPFAPDAMQYTTAAYAAVLGGFQASAALWIRRGRTSDSGRTSRGLALPR